MVFFRTMKRLFTPDIHYQFNKISALTITVTTIHIGSITSLFSQNYIKTKIKK